MRATLGLSKFSAALAAMVFGSHLALAQTSPPATATIESAIGKVMSLAGPVTVERSAVVVVQASVSSGPIALKESDFVYRGDVLQTGPAGKVAITFTDGTSFNLSSNARMVLNEFVYDPNSKSNSSLFSLSKGSFTFVAGALARSGDMKLDTPVATMGIRGTTPHVEISDDGTVRFSTLVEENKIAAPRDSGQQPLSAPRRSSLTPEEAARYNKLFNMDVKICRAC